MKSNTVEEHIFQPLCSKCGEVASTIQLFNKHGKWQLVYDGPGGGNGSGNEIADERARSIIAGFAEPYKVQGIRAADFFDDGGFCLECGQFYCFDHWAISTTGGGRCSKGHFKSLDPHWSPDAAPHGIESVPIHALLNESIQAADGNVRPRADQMVIDAPDSCYTEECLDCIVGFPVAIGMMRDSSDTTVIPNLMVGSTNSAFDDLDQSGESVVGAALPAMDELYQSIVELDVLDVFALHYSMTVVKNFFRNLRKRNCLIFYVLENKLRESRFQTLRTLLIQAGVTVVSPRTTGDNWDALAQQIRDAIGRDSHVVYIEPNATPAYVERALELADEFECVATFRNKAPEDNPRFKLLKLPQS